MILGGRLGYMLFYDFSNFVSNPLIALQIWKGGMASHGGFIGVVLSMVCFARTRKVSFWKIADIVATACTPGIFLGRIANFVNGELWGKVSDFPWAMVFPHSAPAGTAIENIAARHPVAALRGVRGGAFHLPVLQWRFWRGKNLSDGRIAANFFLSTPWCA